jgi:phospholipase/carboxylesterase
MKLARLGELDVRITGGTDREGAGNGPVVVLLHGFGAPGDDLVPLWRTIDAPAGTRFVFPAAPIDLGPRYMGGRAWWFIDLEERLRRQALGDMRDVVEVPPGLDAARGKVDGMLQAVDKALAPPEGGLVLGGFSQGAMLALDTALRSQRPLAGLVLMSGTHIAANEWAARFDARRGLPVFMSHGRADEILPFAVAEGLRDTLIEHGLPVDWVPFREGHGIAPAVVVGVGSFLRRVLRSG